MARAKGGGTNPYSTTAANVAAVAGKDVREDLSTVGERGRRADLSAESIAEIVLSRTTRGDAYTQVGSRALLYLQPGSTRRKAVKSGEINDLTDKYLRTCVPFSELFKPESGPPHLFSIASSAYKHMLGNNDNQAILLLGGMATGKTESHNLLAHFFSKAGGIVVPESKVHEAVKRFRHVLTALTCARTSQNEQSSFSVGYTEYQFDPRGGLCGFQYMLYYFQKERVVGGQLHGQNYLIFHLFTEQLTPEERLAFKVPDAKGFRYMRPGMRIDPKYSGHKGVKGAFSSEITLQSLKKCLKTFVGQRGQEQIWRILAAILHIGNIDFEENDEFRNDPCVIKNESALDQAASMLDISSLELTSVLVNKTRLIGRDTSCFILDRRGCEKQRDSLAHSLYYVILWWIVERANSRFYKAQEGEEDPYTVISVLEAPGFVTENDVGGNLGLHQLFVNYINERLHYFVTESIYKLPNKAFEYEGLTQAYNATKTVDTAGSQESDSRNALATNTYTINLFTDPKTGIFSAIEAGSAQNMKDSKISDEIYNCLQQHEVVTSEKVSSDDASLNLKLKSKHLFRIKHFFGNVTYSTKNFSHSNIDIVQKDFVSLFYGEASPTGMRSTGKFLRNVFSKLVASSGYSKQFASDSVPHLRGLIKKPSIKIKQRSKINSRSKKNAKFDAQLGKSVTNTITFQSRKSFSELLEAIKESQTWILYHLQHPFNRKFLPEITDSNTSNLDHSAALNIVDNPSVKMDLTNQIKMLNIDRLVKNPAVVYTNALPHAEFLERYSRVLPPAVTSSPLYIRNFLQNGSYAKEICEHLASSLKPDSAEKMAVAKTRIFLSGDAWWPLESNVILNLNISDINQVGPSTERGLGDPDTLSQLTADNMTDTFSNYLNNNIGGEKSYAASGNNLENYMYNDTQSIDNATTVSKQDSYADVFSDADEQRNLYDNYSETASMRLYAKEFGKSDGYRDPDANPNIEDDHYGTEVNKKRSRRKPICHKRSLWVCVVYMFTFLIPSFVLSWICRMKTKDRRMAWREKVTLFTLIILLNALALFFVVGLNVLLCPTENALSPGQITERTKLDSSDVVYMYGRYFYVREVYDYGAHKQDNIGKRYWKMYVLGKDVSAMFDREAADRWSDYCPFNRPKQGFGFALETYRQIDPQWYPHNPTLWFSLSKRLQTGNVVWDKESIKQAAEDDRKLIVFHDSVYDVTGFYTPRSNNKGLFFEPDDFAEKLKEIFDNFTTEADTGADASELIDGLRKENPEAWNKTITCMNNLFRVGFVDHRKDLKCRAYSIALLFFTVIISALIVVKFLAAVYSSGVYNPESTQKFVICQIPCYTENESVINRTIESIANLDYDDKYRLLFVVCDGMVVGAGNDIPTPRIVLNILGVSPDEDPEPLMFRSTGEGMLQLNMAKVYSGIYEIKGRDCPFIVVVKVGTPEERFRPGNRGKRDSQLVLMHFLSKLHASEPLNPLELRLCYVMKNIIGVDPRFYEFLMMVDSDTQVSPSSLNYMVSSIVDDEKVIGVCGETNIANERGSLVSMVQVYEYFLSHKMAKGFESLFGSVTCLPGCFCVYRIYNPTSGKVYIANSNVVRLYSKSNIRTLHSRNLLELGEDRYLTTITLKNFPDMKTTFAPRAKASTIVPTKWSVLFSQRRRWINSTVHNLFELLLLNDTCGACIFSLRTVVLIDLIGTFIQPAMIGYIVYLIYVNLTVRESKIPLVLIVAVCLIYSVQILLFLLQKEWQYIGWLVIYTLASLLFNTLIPLYSFWKFDDLSWGNTRKTVDVKGRKVLVNSKGNTNVFDPSIIPLSYYEDYEENLIKQQNQSSLIMQEQYRNDQELQNLYGDASSRASAALSGIESGHNISLIGGTPPTVNSEIGSIYEASHHMMSPPSVIHDKQYGAEEASGVPSLLHEGRQASALMGAPRPLPSDEAILSQIRKIIASADLFQITKKSLRADLEAYFGVDLSTKRGWINRCIDSILRGDV